MREYIMGENIKPWKGGLSQSITFVITQDCNLRCKYCYMTSKNDKNVMSLEVGRRAIDYFLTNKDLFVSDAVVLEFIGGEPLLEIDLIDKLTDYFKIRAYELNHKWFTMYRISISTNGILYSNEKVQKFIKKNEGKVSIGISIDGTKEKNDLQRVYPDGRGTYDDIAKNIKLWQKQFPDATTKVTIGHDDLPYIKESIIHLWNLGLKEIPANVVFENVWEEGDDVIFYNQLRELADYIIDNDMWEEYNTTLFTQGIGYPLSTEELGRNSCGTGNMIAVDASGNLYPCIRFMDYSLNKQKGYITGNIYDGINREKLRPFYYMTVENQSDEECLNCEIASGCQWCTGYNYDESCSGTIFERNKYICKMHKARVKANNYLWSRLVREKNIKLKLQRYGKKFLFIILSDNSVSICNYESKNDEHETISEDRLKETARYCLDNFVTPVLVHSKNETMSKLANKLFFGLDYINIYPSENVQELSHRDIIYHDIKSVMTQKTNAGACILHVMMDESDKLSEAVIYALKYFERVNIQYIYQNEIFDLEKYLIQLKKIADELVEYYKMKKFKQVNVITDDLFNEKRTNCNFGAENFAMAPDGRIFECPAMYYESTGTGTLNLSEIKFGNIKTFNIECNPICKECEINHCQWCFNFNKKITGEFNSPSSLQCKISQTERKSSDYLYKKLIENDMKIFCENYNAEKEYDDPILERKLISLSPLNFSYKIC